MYNIDFDKLITYNVPAFLVRSVFIRWMQLAVSEVSALYDKFIIWKDKLIYDAAHSGQIISLEHVLNDIFDMTSRGIYIDEGERVVQNYIFNDSEDQDDLYMFNESETADPQVYLSNNQEDVEDGYDFAVMVPVALSFSEPRMKALVNVYKIAGKMYKILTY